MLPTSGQGKANQQWADKIKARKSNISLNNCFCASSIHVINSKLILTYLSDVVYHGCDLGAVNAMQDAVVLVNCLYDLIDLSPESLTAAFEDYRSQRFKEAKKQVANSKINARVSSGQV